MAPSVSSGCHLNLPLTKGKMMEEKNWNQMVMTFYVGVRENTIMNLINRWESSLLHKCEKTVRRLTASAPTYGGTFRMVIRIESMLEGTNEIS